MTSEFSNQLAARQFNRLEPILVQYLHHFNHAIKLLRLDDKACSAMIISVPDILLIGRDGEYHHRYAPYVRLSFELNQCLATVHDRHIQIQQDQVGSGGCTR